MNTWPEGWTDVEFKKFKSGEETSESGSDSESDEPIVRGYKKEKYKKLLVVEELLPE